MHPRSPVFSALCAALPPVALFGLLFFWLASAYANPSALRPTHDGRIAAARSQIAQFVTALQLYYVDNDRYPTQRQGLLALIRKPATRPVPRHWRKELDLPEIPKDPWGNPYVYRSPGPRGEPFVVVSYGADGKRGGSGYDADIERAPAPRMVKRRAK